MESDTQTPSGHAKLCAKCEEFGIDERHFQPPFGEKSDDEDEERFSGTFDLGDYRDFSRRPQCPLCSMVATAVREFRVSEGPVDHLEAFMRQATKAQGGFRLHWTHLGATNLRQRMCLEIHSKEIVDDSYVRNLAFNDSPNVKIPGRIVLMRDGGERRQPLLGRAIGEQIDVDLLKGWLQKCVDWHSDASHEDHCQRLVLPQSIDPRQVDAFLVIDVVDECLTKPPSNCLFSALSYKWGGVNGLQAKVENITTLETVGSLGRLQHEIPNTIRDAMGLTRDLELRYLWVDQLCIVQDDLENKQAAIDSMAGVYAFAHLTIIAADGDDANAGLRGYGRRIRGYEQESFSLQPSLQLLLIPDLVSTLAASLYEDRAWT